MVRIKICGITREVDATAAVEWGVSALGFIFAKSPREITPQKARDITRSISPFVKTVGVFVNEQPAKIRGIMDFCGLDLVQLHGDESVSTCSELAPRVIKAFRIKGEISLLEIAKFKNHVRAVLLDTYQKDIHGGTGRAFDWRLAIKAKESGIPVVLSGGLKIENIQEALIRVNPSAIDVSSGIEESPGIKDHERMKRFMEKVVNFHGNKKTTGGA
ncbi:MAG: phosphoribosylanthranilate isomerase [Deltaproteobacteria bacterium]|nr:phosphoribosylanthranilate isomerase [Deltaproteobacteria bacterium]